MYLILKFFSDWFGISEVQISNKYCISLKLEHKKIVTKGVASLWSKIASLIDLSQPEFLKMSFDNKNLAEFWQEYHIIEMCKVKVFICYSLSLLLHLYYLSLLYYMSSLQLSNWATILVKLNNCIGRNI